MSLEPGQYRGRKCERGQHFRGEQGERRARREGGEEEKKEEEEEEEDGRR